MMEQGQAITETADVIVVGGGPAGAACAWDLAAAGVDVLILDHQQFPRFKPCAGGLTIKALARLRYSVAPVVRAVSDSMDTSLNLRRQTCLQAPGPICVLTVRSELDAFCLEQTLANGARFRKIDGVAAVEADDCGVVVKTPSGATFRGQYLVGADGAHSRVRKLTGQFVPDRTAVALEATIPVERVGKMPGFTFDFGVVGQGYGWLFPKGDHVNVGIYTRRPEEVAFSRALLLDYARQRVGSDVLEHLAGYPIGTGGEAYRPASGRVLLAGDAAGFAEPLLGEGLHNAILSGQIAAQSILYSLQCTDGDAGQHYASNLGELQADLVNSRWVAKAFYKFLPLSFGVLKHGVQKPLLYGFASGKTLTGCKRAAFTPGARYELATLPPTLADLGFPRVK